MESFGGCNLRKNFKKLDNPSEDNVYNHNNEGKFCDCKNEYTIDTTSTMFQCLLGEACKEDWYHEECILGIPLIQRDSNSGKPQGENLYDKLESAESENIQAVDDDKDETLEGLPNSSDFAAFVCWKCVKLYKPLMVKFGQWKDVSLSPVFHGEFKNIEHRREKLADPSAGSKRKNNEQEEGSDDDHEQSKKQKTESGSKSASAALSKHSKNDFSLFLIDGYQDVLKECKDADVVEFVKKFPFMIEEEPEYEPPPDNDANSSLLDAGTRALQSLPREQAIDGMHAYEAIKNQLKDFLKPFAEEGKVVTETDVNSFFASMEQAAAK